MTNATTRRRAHPLAPTAFDPATSPVGAGSSATSSWFAGVLLAGGLQEVHTRQRSAAAMRSHATAYRPGSRSRYAPWTPR